MIAIRLIEILLIVTKTMIDLGQGIKVQISIKIKIKGQTGNLKGIAEAIRGIVIVAPTRTTGQIIMATITKVITIVTAAAEDIDIHTHKCNLINSF